MGRHSLPDDFATRPNGNSSRPRRRRTAVIATMLVLGVAAGTAVTAQGVLLSFSRSCEVSAVRLSLMTSPGSPHPCVRSPTRRARTRSGPTGAASMSRSSPAIRTRSPMRSPPAPAPRTTGSGCPTPISGWIASRHGRGHPDHTRRLHRFLAGHPRRDPVGGEGSRPAEEGVLLGRVNGLDDEVGQGASRCGRSRAQCHRPARSHRHRRFVGRAGRRSHSRPVCRGSSTPS